MILKLTREFSGFFCRLPHILSPLRISLTMKKVLKYDVSKKIGKKWQMVIWNVRENGIDHL